MITIDGYIVDAALVEQHQLDNEITENPIEKGGIINDHVYEMPDVITLDCVVSDTPLGPVALARGSELDGNTPSLDAYERMKFIRRRGETVVITTSLGIHKDMMLWKLGIPRKADDGECLKFQVSFKAMTFVSNERTVVRIAVPQQAKRVDRGNKPAKTPPDNAAAPETKKNASILYTLLH